MNIVLLSGGSGQRLWPLSNEIRSKQFIKIFHKEDGELESMVQRVYRQIRTVDSEGIDGLPKSDVLKFFLEDNCSIVVRPSGTEPKLKAYISVSATTKEEAQVVEGKLARAVEEKM